MKSTFYTAGQHAALEKLGVSTAGMREAVLNALKSKQYGEVLTRVPVQAAVGGVLGAGTGSLSDNPWQGAGLGVLGGVGGGIAISAAPQLRNMLIKRLQQSTKVADARPLMVRQRVDPFTEIHRKTNQVFKLKMPKFDMGALLARQINNPLKQPRLHLSGKTPPLRM